MTFNMTKRSWHPFAEQFNYFQDPNEFKFGYQIENYHNRLKSMWLNTTVFGTHYRNAKNLQGYFFSQEFKRIEMPESIKKLGIWAITPEVKISQSRRGIELNCAEQAYKKSFTIKMDCRFGFVDSLINKMIGSNYGY